MPPNPNVRPDAKFQRALAHCHAGDLTRAKGLCQEIISLRPRHTDALQLLGLIASQEGDLSRAAGFFDQVVRIDPGNAAAWVNRGSAYRDLGRREAALHSYDRALALDGSLAEAHYNRATVLRELQRSAESLASCDKAIALNSNLCEALVLRGSLLRAAERKAEAATAFARAVALSPPRADFYVELASTLSELRQFDAALDAFDRAIALESDLTAAALGRANTLYELGRLPEALEGYERVISVQPDIAQAHSNRGNVLREMGEPDAALASYDRAIALQHDLATAHCNRANLLAELNQFELARASYANALGINPTDAGFHCNLAVMQLRTGDFERGWANFEWRHKLARPKGPSVELFERRWLGQEAISGKRILLRSEQGLGDTLQFCRYAPLVAELQAEVFIEAPRPLLGLLTSVQGVAQVLEKGTEAEFDYECPLLSLPLAFNTRLTTIPCAERYLWSDPARVGVWEKRLGPRAAPRIGLVWHGSGNQRHDRRSAPLEELIDRLPPRFQFVSLQKEVSEHDLRLLTTSQRILDCRDEIQDFSDTAALCECMDLVISVDTSVAHLSAALGKRTWVLLGQNPDWRWMMDRTDSPWYPTVRLYRQGISGGWGEMFARVFSELEKILR